MGADYYRRLCNQRTWQGISFYSGRLIGYLKDANVKIQTKAKVESIDEEGVTYTDANGNKISVPEVTVVSAFGYRSYNPLEDAAKKICDNVQVISGAAKVGNALVAIAEGYTAALNL